MELHKLRICSRRVNAKPRLSNSRVRVLMRGGTAGSLAHTSVITDRQDNNYRCTFEPNTLPLVHPSGLCTHAVVSAAASVLIYMFWLSLED